MNRKMLTVTLCFALPILTACATINRGTSEPFEVQTTPSGAPVTTSLGKGCAPPPCIIPNVRREADFKVTIKKKGYKPMSYNITHVRADGGGANLAGNVIFSAGMGAVLDANNGSTQALAPNPLIVSLEPVHAGPKPVAQIVDDIYDKAVGREK